MCMLVKCVVNMFTRSITEGSSKEANTVCAVVCECVYVRMYTYIYMYTHIHTYMHIHIFSYVCTSTHGGDRT